MDNFISVIVCTYNRESYIGKCLDHLHRQTANKAIYEVIIIDNCSTDATASICKEKISQFQETSFQYFFESNQGLSHARNRGIQESKGTILAFLDDDAFAMPDYIVKLEQYFKNSPLTLAIGGKIIPVYEGAKPKWMTRYLLPLVAAQDLGDRIMPFTGNKFPIGANMVFQKWVFEKYGLFNVNLGRKGTALEASEEKELFIKLKKAGEAIIYVPTVSVHHIIPQNRIETNYIKRLALGIGTSERKRLVQASGADVVNKIGEETIKSIGTVVLFFIYVLGGRMAAATMLVKFRFWVIKGLLTGK